MAQANTKVMELPLAMGSEGATINITKIVLSGGATTASLTPGRSIKFACIVQAAGANFPDLDWTTTAGTLLIGGNVAAGANATLYVMMVLGGN